jgi:hypothetical protein
MVEIKSNENQSPVPSMNIPIVYSNGFITNVGASDISIIFLLDGIPAIKLHMSFTATKTIAKSMTDIVDVLEKATSHPIMLSSEVEAGLKRMSE